jgi:Fur family ferric uptake transcriptional regulator
VFELAKGEHHDHMVCVNSGEVVEFTDPLIEERQRQIASEHGFDLVDHSLVLYVRKRGEG